MKKKNLKKENNNYFEEKNRPTTNKNTFISSNYRLLKVDTYSLPIGEDTLSKIIDKIKNEKSDITVLVILDTVYLIQEALQN